MGNEGRDSERPDRDTLRTGARPRPSRSLLKLKRTSTLTLNEFRLVPMSLVVLLIAVPILFLAWLGQGWIDRSLRATAKNSLSATVNAAAAGVELLLEASRDAALSTTRNRTFVALAEAHAKTCEPRRTCIDPAISERIELVLYPIGRRNVLIDRAKRSAFPLFDRDLSRKEEAELLRIATGVEAKRPKFLSPFRLSEDLVLSGFFVPLEGTELSMFFEIGSETISRPLLAARAGQSGETYAVDTTGHMVSESRFPAVLRRIGLLRPIDTSTILSIDVRDPGVDFTKGERTELLRSEQPLTRAASAIQNLKSGVATDGYRDYRGVLVVGAYHYLPEWNLGIVSEVDEHEALASLREVHRLFLFLLGSLGAVLLGLILLAFVAARSNRKAERALEKAESLGQYQIERKLGEGGMGTVYLAHHALLRRPTAIKVMRPERASDEAFTRFEREAKATSELTSPHTVAIFDFGRANDGTFYYAMEYLEGLDLEQLVGKTGPLPQARVVHILAQICISLDEAHKKNLVHRDIKPSNIFLCRSTGLLDFAKVLDFGIVKSSLSESAQITRSSSIMGTPEFMAPEMFGRGEEITGKADVYSLGCVAYFLLTARPVFAARSLAELCTAHLSEEPKRPSLRAKIEIHPDFEELVLACLAKDPKARPRDAARLRKLLLDLEVPPWRDSDAEAEWKKVDEIDAPKEPRAS